MAKTLFCVALTACLVAISQQQSDVQKLDAYKTALQVDNLLAIAQNVSKVILKLSEEAEKSYIYFNIRSSNNISFSYNVTIQPYLDAINNAFLLVNATNNIAAKACVTKAQASIRQTASTGGKATYNCLIATRIKLYNFVTNITSLDVGPTSRLAVVAFDAASDCPNRYSFASVAEVNIAKACYVAAATKLKNYISQTSKTLAELELVYKELIQNTSNCVSGGTETVIRDAQSVVDNMVTCGKAAGMLLLPGNVIDVINADATDIDYFVSDVYASIENAYLAMNCSYDKIVNTNDTADNYHIEIMQTTLYYIEYVEEFLGDSPTSDEQKCVNNARGEYIDAIDAETYYTRGCLQDIADNFNTKSLVQEEIRLKELLTNASAKAVDKCTSLPTITQESVNKCMVDELSRLQSLAWDDYDISESLIDFAQTISNDVDECVEYHQRHSTEYNEEVIYNLSRCLAKLDIEFTYEI